MRRAFNGPQMVAYGGMRPNGDVPTFKYNGVRRTDSNPFLQYGSFQRSFPGLTLRGCGCVGADDNATPKKDPYATDKSQAIAAVLFIAIIGAALIGYGRAPENRK